MAANTSPIFILTHIADAPTASFSTPNADLTGATSTGMVTVATGGTNGSQVAAIKVIAITKTLIPNFINVFQNRGGTRTLIGQIPVTVGIDPSEPGTAAWIGTWNNPAASFVLKAADTIDVVPMFGKTVYRAWAIGGDF